MENLKSHSHIVQLDHTGQLVLIEDNLKAILNHWNTFNTQLPVRFVAFAGEERSGNTLLTYLLIQYFEKNQGPNWIEELQSEWNVNQKGKLSGFTLNGVLNARQGNSETNAGIYLWPKPYQIKSGNSGTIQVWILHVIANTESDSSIFEQFLLLVCSNMIEIIGKKKEFRLAECMENLLPSGVYTEDITDSITYAICSTNCESSKGTQGLNTNDVSGSMKLGKFKNITLTDLKDFPQSLLDNYENVNLAEISNMKSGLNRLVKLVVHNVCKSTFKNFLETGICQQVLQNAVCKVNKVGLASKSGLMQNEAAVMPRNTALKQFCLTQLYCETRITYVTVEPVEQVLNHKKTNFLNLTPQANHHNGSCVALKLPNQFSLNVLTDPEGNQQSNENKVDGSLNGIDLQFDNNEFQSTLLYKITERINANLNYRNVLELLGNCFEATVIDFPQMPQSMYQLYNELLQQLGSCVDDYCKRIRFYFKRHYVCFEKISGLEYFNKKEMDQAIISIKASVANEYQTFVCTILNNACSMLYNMYLKDNIKIFELEQRMVSALSQEIRNFYNGEMERLQSNKSSSLSLETLLHCNKVLTDRCVKMFETCSDSEGKANGAAIAIQKMLDQNLQKDFMVHKGKYDRASWRSPTSNNTTAKMKIGDENMDEIHSPKFCQTIKLSNCGDRMSIKQDCYNSLVVQVTTQNITMGCIQEDGSPKIIRNNWNKNSTLAIIGVTQANEILYGAALSAKLDTCGKSFLTLGSLNRILLEKRKPNCNKKGKFTRAQKTKITLELLFGELINQLTLSAECSTRRTFHTLIIAIPSWITAEQKIKLERGVITYSKFGSVKFFEENICIARSFFKSEHFQENSESSIIVLSQNSGFIDLGMHKREPAPLLTSLIAKDHVKYKGKIPPKLVLQLFVSSCVFMAALRKFLKSLKSTSRLMAFLKTHSSKQEDLFKGFIVAGNEKCTLTKERRGQYFTKAYSLKDTKLAVIEGAMLSVVDGSDCSISVQNVDCQNTGDCKFSHLPVNIRAPMSTSITGVESSKNPVKVQFMDCDDELSKVVVHLAEHDSKSGKNIINYDIKSNQTQCLLQLCEQLQRTIDVTHFDSRFFRNLTLKKVDAGHKLALSKSSTLEEIQKQIGLLKKLDAELTRCQKMP